MEDGTRLLSDSEPHGWRTICQDLGADTATIMGAGMYNMALNFAEIERKFMPLRAAEPFLPRSPLELEAAGLVARG